jgi:acetoin utilization protein AcuB
MAIQKTRKPTARRAPVRQAPATQAKAPTVADFMSPALYTIGRGQPLAEAHRLMNDHGIRHLPVLDGGRLVGMLSQRDLHLVETLRDVDPAQVTVDEAMSQEVLTVLPSAPLQKVASTMAQHKYGSALVVGPKGLEGIFTTVDALRALGTVLGEGPG